MFNCFPNLNAVPVAWSSSCAINLSTNISDEILIAQSYIASDQGNAHKSAFVWWGDIHNVWNVLNCFYSYATSRFVSIYVNVYNIPTYIGVFSTIKKLFFPCQLYSKIDFDKSSQQSEKEQCTQMYVSDNGEESDVWLHCSTRHQRDKHTAKGWTNQLFEKYSCFVIKCHALLKQCLRSTKINRFTLLCT